MILRMRSAGGRRIASYNQLQHAARVLRQIIATGGALPPASLESWPTPATHAERGSWFGLAASNRH